MRDLTERSVCIWLRRFDSSKLSAPVMTLDSRDIELEQLAWRLMRGEYHYKGYFTDLQLKSFSALA